MPRLKRSWSPHPKQRLILQDDHRFRVVPAGRRFGKTYMARHEAFEFAFENPESLVWYVAPTDEDARELAFAPLKQAIPRDLLAEEPRESPPRSITLVNEARMVFKSAESQGRGRGLDHVVIDEAGEVGNRVTGYWPEVIRPSLSDTAGTALIIGTPAGRNFFFDMFQRGEDPDDDEVSSWQASTYDNPHVPDAEVEQARATLPERVFRQEYLAEFVDESGTVFDYETRPYTVADVEGREPYTTGVDLARTSNYLVATTIDADGMLVGFMRRRGGSWAAAHRALEQYLADYPGDAYLDATRDNKVVEDLARSVAGHVDVEPVRFTPQAKADLVENLAARLETRDVVLPAASGPTAERETDALLRELDVFTYDTTPSGNVRYHAPEGYNDDAVDALALAAKHAQAARATW